MSSSSSSLSASKGSSGSVLSSSAWTYAATAAIGVASGVALSKLFLIYYRKCHGGKGKRCAPKFCGVSSSSSSSSATESVALSASSLPRSLNPSLLECPHSSVLLVCRAPVNIAVIKYWGKRDSNLHLPTNGSLSATLAMDSLCSTTAIVASRSFEKDEMYLNGKLEDVSNSKRFAAVLGELRTRASDYIDGKTGRVVIRSADWKDYKLKIVSFNNFPTAAGLASSASGFACLTYTAAMLLRAKESFPGELTTIARQGSGSACRSMFGGWVKWEEGKSVDGSDSIAVQVADENVWPSMRVLILVASASAKEVASTKGMQLTVETSALLKHRAQAVVPKRLEEMENAIKNRDYQQFAELTMADSNQFHAVCLDTMPPIFYLNDTSKSIIHLVHKINEFANRSVVAYTFDAGPNACLYLEDKNLPLVLSLVRKYFGADSSAGWLFDPMNLENAVDKAEKLFENDAAVEKFLSTLQKKPEHVVVKSAILTKVGAGPQILREENTM